MNHPSSIGYRYPKAPAPSPFVTQAVVNASILRHEARPDPHPQYTPVESLAQTIKGMISAGTIPIYLSDGTDFHLLAVDALDALSGANVGPAVP